MNLSGEQAHWEVGIDSVEGDERLILEALSAIGLNLTRHSDGWILTSALFEAMEDHRRVRDAADHACHHLCQVLMYQGHGKNRIALGDTIHETTNDGKRRKHISVSVQAVAGRAIVAGVGTVTHSTSPEERSRQESERREREFQVALKETVTAIRASLRVPEVIDMMQRLSGDPSINDLNHVAEIIEDNMGGEIGRIISRNELDRFFRSINHPDVLGSKARHARSNVKPPPRPMTEKEAIDFARRLSDAWIQYLSDKTANS